LRSSLRSALLGSSLNEPLWLNQDRIKKKNGNNQKIKDTKKTNNKKIFDLSMDGVSVLLNCYLLTERKTNNRKRTPGIGYTNKVSFSNILLKSVILLIVTITYIYQWKDF